MFVVYVVKPTSSGKKDFLHSLHSYIHFGPILQEVQMFLPFLIQYLQLLRAEALHELDWTKHIHMSLCFFALIIILFSVAKFIMAFVDSCTWLESPLSMTSSRVQSSAYLFVLIVRWSGIESSRSFIWTLNSIGEMTEPWGTPAGQGAIDDMTPCKFTCWVLPVRKHFTQDQKVLDITNR